jgi:hypothetical protein
MFLTLSIDCSLTRQHDCRGESHGDGVERDVITTAFATFIETEAQWLVEHANGFCSLAPTSTLSMRPLPDSRRRALHSFGALAALFLIHGFPPEPLDPLLLQYLLNGNNLHSLHPNLVQEWQPELYQTITDWLATGPDGDLAPFQSHLINYCGVQVSFQHYFLT